MCDTSVNKVLLFRVPIPPFGFGDDQISIFTEIPDMVVPRKKPPVSSLVLKLELRLTTSLPVGEASYNSNITAHSEVLPVSVDLMGKPYPFHFSPRAQFPETLV